MLAQDAADRRRARPFRHQHTRRADRHRKGQPVAKPIGEEQFRRRERDVAFGDAEHRDGIELGGLHEARMDVNRTLRPAGRARGIEPEAGLVGMRRRGVEDGGRSSEQGGERAGSRLGAGDDRRGPRLGQLRQCRRHRGQYRRRHDNRASPAVGQHKGEFFRRQLGVDRDRHDPALDRPEKRGREVDRIMQAEQDPLLRMDPEPAYAIGEPACPLGKLGIAVMPVIVDKRRFRAAPGREVPLDQIGSGVVCRSALHRRASLPEVVATAGSIIYPACALQARGRSCGRA